MAGFVGRQRELAELSALLETVRRGQRADRGVAVTIRGRRRIGKSRLVDELTRRADVPFVYFQAARHAPVADELAELTRTIALSDLPDAAVASGVTPDSLTAALTLLDAALPSDQPTIVVIDELPWLLEQLPGGAGELQRVWDRRLSRKPVLLLLLGSDLAMMEHLLAADQPFHGRATPMVIEALTPADIRAMTELDPFDAFDAYLVTGGQPLVAQEWEPHDTLTSFLTRSFASSTSALVVSGSRVLDSELPPRTSARRVLTAIGGRGERTFSTIQARAGAGEPLNAATLTAALRTLVDKRVVALDEPLSAKPSHKLGRYRVADPALRFWLPFVEPALAEVDRGRPDLATARVAAGYAAWRGRAVEPVVRQALRRMLPDTTFPDVVAVGAWWNRSNTPEIDLTAADGSGGLALVGTVKWRRDAPLTDAEAHALADAAIVVPGARPTTPLVGVCPGGSVTDRFTAVWTADDLIAAWP